MKFERRLHNGKWAAYVRVLGIWWFIRDFDNAKKAGYFVGIAMGQNILRPRKEKKVPPPAAPSVIGSHEFEGDSSDGPYRVGSDILVTAIQNPFDDTKKWPDGETPEREYRSYHLHAGGLCLHPLRLQVSGPDHGYHEPVHRGGYTQNH